MKRNVWTLAQDTVLRLRYADESTAAIAASLGLGMTQVYARAHYLGLHKSPAYLATSQERSNFLEIPPDAAVAHLGNMPDPARRNGIASITRHHLKG